MEAGLPAAIGITKMHHAGTNALHNHKIAQQSRCTSIERKETLTLSAMITTAPRSNSSCATSLRPLWLATCKGVQPSCKVQCADTGTSGGKTRVCGHSCQCCCVAGCNDLHSAAENALILTYASGWLKNPKIILHYGSRAPSSNMHQ